jgi:hypothetical protein
MADITFIGGDRLGGSNWTLDEFLDSTSKHILVIGPNLHHLATHHARYWKKISKWLEEDRSRSLQLVISNDLSHDRWEHGKEHLAESKRVFTTWVSDAGDYDPPLKLSASTLRSTIRTGLTIVNPDENDGFAVLVPLITQPIPGDKFFFVVQRSKQPGVFGSLWGQVQDLLRHGGREPLRARGTPSN